MGFRLHITCSSTLRDADIGGRFLNGLKPVFPPVDIQHTPCPCIQNHYLVMHDVRKIYFELYRMHTFCFLSPRCVCAGCWWFGILALFIMLVTRHFSHLLDTSYAMPCSLRIKKVRFCRPLLAAVKPLLPPPCMI